jgi:hypothetical protein
MHIVSHYEACLEKYKDTHKGVDWPNRRDAVTRYGVMLDVIGGRPRKRVTMLDFGCGASHLYEYMRRHKLHTIDYSGLDISEKFIELSRKKHPHITYYCLDVLDEQAALPSFDYIVMNGVFTEKTTLTYREMLGYFQTVIQKVFNKARIGLAFNVMSKQVDWERKDLFHLEFDVLAAFLKTHVSRHFIFRHDYGLYEYTTYVYRHPQPSGRGGSGPRTWRK